MKNLLKKSSGRKSRVPAAPQAHARRPVRTRPTLERLEDRLAPATFTYEWTGLGADNLWSDSANWTNGGPANAGVDNTVDLLFHSNTHQEASSVDNISLTGVPTPALGSVTFDANNFSNPIAVGYNAGGTDVTGGYTITGTGSMTITAAAGITVASGLNLGGITETINGPSIAAGRRPNVGHQRRLGDA